MLVSQQGCDTHAEDPLAHLLLTVDGQRASYRAVHELAHRAAGGRWVAIGGGGYAIVDVVPRAWAHLVGEVVGRPVEVTPRCRRSGASTSATSWAGRPRAS